MSPITRFYENRSIFITGVTGFLGKATVEKLLRTCRGVETVYVLIRPKSSIDVQARLAKLFDNALFNTLREQDPYALKKIVPINGDISLPNLGISDEDQQILIHNVSIVIHSAATVKFDEKMKLSVNINVVGTKQIVELCKRMPKLVALVHVSTAYANCEREEIDEIVYPPGADPTKLIEFMEGIDDNLIESITPHLIGNKPNTYTYTKGLAEYIFTEELNENLPVCIIRPSIVTATWKEPVAGWVDNMNGPTGLMVAGGQGVLRTLLCDKNNVADLIPLDFPVNLILCAAWYTAEHKQDGIKVYNCCSGTQNPLSWGFFVKEGLSKHFVSSSIKGAFLHPNITLQPNKMRNNINKFFVHYLPAYIIDLGTSLTQRKPVMLKIYKKLMIALKSLEFFTINQWRFKTNNMVALYEMLSPEDKEMFNLNVKEVKWPEYIGNYWNGVRKYVLKDEHSTLPTARKQVWGGCWMRKFSRLILILIFWRAIMFKSKKARQVWFAMFQFVIRMIRMLPLGENI